MTDIYTTRELRDVVEALRYKTFPVLSDGHIMLVDVMGGDQDIVDAARISYGRGTKRASEDAHLIRYLMRHRHTTPFEMVEFKFRVRVPMDAWRQWIRHRTASVNEYSTRYSDAIDVNDTTSPVQWRSQSKSNKQGSDLAVIEWPEDWKIVQDPGLEDYPEYMLGPRGSGKLYVRPGMTPGEFLSQRERSVHEYTREVYNERLHFGVAREQARKDLCLSTYTEAYWKIDLHNLFHFLSLRMDKHAQKEIRDYAVVMGNEIVANVVPVAWDAFCDYRLNALTLTALDIWVIQRLTRAIQDKQSLGGDSVAYSLERFMEAQDPSWTDLARCRERDECLAKLQRLGIVE